MRARQLFSILLVAVLAGCASAGKPTATSSIDLPIIVSTEAFVDINVELADDGEWWKLDSYGGRVFDFQRHGFFYDRICRPELEVLATVTRPKLHSFIREDAEEIERVRLLRERAAGMRFVVFDLAPVTLDDLEEEFFVNALPRLKENATSHSCYDWYD